MATSEGLKPLFTPEQIQEKFDEYKKKKGREHKVPITYSGFCIKCLGVSRDYIRQLEESKNGKEYSGTIKSIKDYIEQDKHEGALSGAYNTAFTIFDLKHNSKRSDRQEIVQTNINQVSEDDLQD